MSISSPKGYSWNDLKTSDQRCIAEILNECNVIKYAAYRVAAKSRIVQHTMCMEQVRLGIIAGVFDRHHLHKTENEILVEYVDLEAVTHDIFFATQKEIQSDLDVDLCTETMTNFLLDIYDSDKSKSVKVISAKTFLTVMCSSSLQEKYQYLFHQFADHNSCISQKKLTNLLKNLTCITGYFSESLSFGEELIPGSVKSCFKNSIGPLGVTEDDFLDWLSLEPQLLVWHSTFYRMQAAESVTHTAKCSACKMYPIVGLRYHCLRCLRYDQCQNCFSIGKLSKGHKLTHPMEEYCSKVSSKEATLTFLKILKNKLCGTSSEMHFLPVQGGSTTHGNGNIADGLDLKWPSNCDAVRDGGYLSDEVELSTKTVGLVNALQDRKEVQPHCELQSIICHLEEDNRQLQLDIGKLWAKKDISLVGECLNDHRQLVEAQVKRLKQLKVHLLQMRPSLPRRPLEHLESTPVLPATFRYGRRGIISSPGLDNISPIMREEDETRISMECKKLQTTNIECNTYSEKLPEKTEIKSLHLSSLSECSATDISMWLGEKATLKGVTTRSGLSTWLHDSHETSGEKLKELHEDLDQILERLQSMLSSNFGFEDTFSGKDNAQLQKATGEIEDWLTSLVDEVENQKRNSDHRYSSTQTPAT